MPLHTCTILYTGTCEYWQPVYKSEEV